MIKTLNFNTRHLDSWLEDFRKLKSPMKGMKHKAIFPAKRHYDQQFREIDTQMYQLREQKLAILFKDLKAVVTNPESYRDGLTEKEAKTIENVFDLIEASTKRASDRIGMLHHFIVGKLDDYEKILRAFPPFSRLHHDVYGFLTMSDSLKRFYFERIE